MTVETETILIKLLEELKADFRELKADVKDLSRKFENQQKDITDIKVTLAEVKVEIVNTKKDVDEVKNDIKGRISIQTYWFLVLISLLIGIVGKFAFYPNSQ